MIALSCFIFPNSWAGTTASSLTNFFHTLKPEKSLSHRCDVTHAAMQARLHWSRISAGGKIVVNPWVTRPIAGSANAYQGLESMYDSAHFRVHYVNKTLFRNDVDAAFFTVVLAVSTALEKAWNIDHSVLGYATPPSDGALVNNGGNALYDVYLKDIGKMGLLGFTTSDAVGTTDPTRPFGTYSFIVMDNDFSYPEYGYIDPSIAIRVTAAHEYFHAVQFGYDPSEQVAFAEQASTWVEDKVYPNLHDNFNYVGEVYVDSNGNGQFDATESFTDRNADGQRNGGSQNKPEFALDYVTATGDIQYGRFLWAQYLSEKFGDLIMRNIWEEASLVAGNYSFGAMNSALLTRGSSLRKAYQEYAVWAYRVENFLYGANYPRAWVEKTFTSAVVNVTSNTLPSLQRTQTFQEHLSSIYIQVYNPTGDYFFSATGGQAALSAITEYQNGTFTVDDVVMSANQATWLTPVNAVRVVFVVSNVSFVLDDMQWTLTSRQRGVATVAQISTKNVIATSVAGKTAGPTLAQGILATQQDIVAVQKRAGCLVPMNDEAWLWLLLLCCFLAVLCRVHMQS